MNRKLRYFFMSALVSALNSLSPFAVAAEAYYAGAFVQAVRVEADVTPARLWVTFARNDGTGLAQSCVADADMMSIDNAAVALMASMTRREITGNRVFIACDSQANGARLLSVMY